MSILLSRGVFSKKIAMCRGNRTVCVCVCVSKGECVHPKISDVSRQSYCVCVCVCVCVCERERE